MTIPTEYPQIVRRSYGTLCHATHALEAARPCPDGGYLEEVRTYIHALVDRLIWSDGMLAPGELAAIDEILEEDRKYGGKLLDRLGKTEPDPDVLERVPAFLSVCREYDAANDTSLVGSVTNAIESLALAFLATDRKISEAEFDALQKTLEPIRAFRKMTMRIEA